MILHLDQNIFHEHYRDFIDKWIAEIKKLGIKKIDGRVITDDSYYDFRLFRPNGYGKMPAIIMVQEHMDLSVFDNTYEIHFKTSSDSSHGSYQSICSIRTWNMSSQTGLLQQALQMKVMFLPHHTAQTVGWQEPYPSTRKIIVLKASVTDPPLFIAKIINEKLEVQE